MSESKHTPGPWKTKISGGERDVFSVKDIHGHVLARVSGYAISAITPEQRRANARLIAAAPDLLEALKKVVAMCDAGALAALDIDAIRDDIAKAEPKS